MSPKTADALIIGGGVIGASIAYYLAWRQVRVVLLEKGELAGGTSGACDGLVFLQSKKPGIHLELALTSQKLFLELDRRLPVPIHYQNKGGLIVVESEEEQEAMQSHVQKCRSNGLDVSLLDRRDLLQMEPHLSPELLGAAYSPLDSQVNPISLTQGLALGAKDLGAEILT
ncbi:MAG: NAD(P)/FAD-dependent oxidoreductase, partial [Thermodesulfobacteriota bacterium]